MFIVKTIDDCKYVTRPPYGKGTWILTEDKNKARIFSTRRAIALSFRGNYEAKMWDKYYLNQTKFREVMKTVPDYRESYEVIEVSLIEKYENK